MTVKLVKEKGVISLPGIDAEKIYSLLKVKHSKDVIIPECKNGETWGVRDLLKLDAWVLRRTYSPLTTIGYEIKCSRQDFEQDQKWTNYLDLCHAFYFVCPAGLIRATDLPNSIGIIWASKDRLHTKRKAEIRKPNIEKLNRLLIYVVMSRSKIVGNMNEIYDEPPKDNLQLRRDSVERANEKQELAYFVRGHVKTLYEQTMKAGRELKHREETIKRFEYKLSKLGLTWDSQTDRWQDNMKVDAEIDALKKVFDDFTLSDMRMLSRKLDDVAVTIKRLRE